MVKKGLFKNFALLLSITVLIASCSRHPLFLKKRYSSGYRLLTGKSESRNKKCTVEEKKHEKMAIRDIFVLTDNSLTAGITNSPDVSPSIPSSVQNLHLYHSRPLIESKSLQKETHSKNISPSFSHKKSNKIFNQNQNKKNDSDTELIILVILSLFPILSLIAVYLKDGKKITINFWITLILHFFILWWLFALLRVLDVINLA